MNDALEKNVQLYPYFRLAGDALAWLPVFFLFFSQYLSLSEVLALEAIYYIAVVFAEVPSGYFSDRFGRCKTLRVSCAALLACYVFFLFGESFYALATGQVLLAFSLAFRSGTDTSLLYESLKVLGRDGEYGDREAKAGQYGFIATAIAALAGGVAGSIDLSWPYWISLATALLTLLVVTQFTEPERSCSVTPQQIARNFVEQLGDCFRYLRTPLLAALFIYYVYLYMIVHVPYEFYQPYLALLDDGDRLSGYSAPLLAGILFAMTAMVGSFASKYSMGLLRRFGLVGLLGGAALIELVVIASMAIWLHPVLALLVIVRSGPMAVVAAPINSTIAPLISDAHRATFLSLRSLAGRLAFSAMLAGFAFLIPHDSAIEWDALSLVLRVALVTGVAGILALWVMTRRVTFDNLS
jgi:MFS family permease